MARRFLRIGMTLLVGLAVAAAAGLLFAFDWLIYSLSEGGPSYYRFSTYMEYRDALSGGSGIAIGSAYAVLAGSLAAAATLARRRLDGAWTASLAVAAAAAVALPVVVPAVLPRAEYGKDPALHVTDVYEQSAAVCLTYAPAPPSDPLDRGRTAPALCVDLRPAAAASRDGVAYAVAERLNDSDVEPYDEAGTTAIEGVKIVGARWARPGEPKPVPQPNDPDARPVQVRLGEQRTKRNVLRVARQLQRCRRTTGEYTGCIDRGRARRIGVTIAARGEAYSVGATSVRLNTYSVDHPPGGPTKRGCVQRGVGECPPSGNW